MPEAIQFELCDSWSADSGPSKATASQTQVQAGPGRGATAPAPAGLPCLNSIISNGTPSSANTDGHFDHLATGGVFSLTPGQARTAFALNYNVKALAAKFGIQRLGFLTLTFRDHVTELKEAQRRFNSLKTGVLKKRYVEWIAVPERMKSEKSGKAKGRIHFHCLVVLQEDIRTGADFKAFEECNYTSANPELRREWAFWRETAPKYRFGRTEMLPVKSTSDAIAAYVGKYISKHIRKRDEKDRGHKLVLCSKGARRATTRFSWHSVKAWLWRAKLSATAHKLGLTDLGQFKEMFGESWAFHLSDIISKIELKEYPTLEHAAKDNREVEGFPEDTINLTLGSRHAEMTKEEFESYLRNNYRAVKWVNELLQGMEEIPF
jgi:hypothetical protein